MRKVNSDPCFRTRVFAARNDRTNDEVHDPCGGFLIDKLPTKAEHREPNPGYGVYFALGQWVFVDGFRLYRKDRRITAVGARRLVGLPQVSGGFGPPS